MKKLITQIQRIFGPSKEPLKYSSAETRSTSLHSFMGIAAGDEVQKGHCPTPYDNRENLELKFRSGVNRSDIPSAFGPTNWDRRIADKKPSLASEIFSFVRYRGEVRD